MFVKKSTYSNVVDENEILKDDIKSLRARLDHALAKLNAETTSNQKLATDLNKARQALHAIVKQETPHRNATVGRMVRYAKMALNGTFGNKKASN